MRRFAGPLIWTAYVAWPAHLGGLFHGVPLQPLDSLSLLIVWWLTCVERRVHRLWPGASILAAAVVISASMAGEPGFRARYYANSDAREPFERSTEYPASNFTRVDETLDFTQGRAEFPLAFFNDIARFNFYNPGEPARDKLPFAVAWEGYWWIDGDPRSHTLYVDAPRATGQLIVDGSTVLSTTSEAEPAATQLTMAPGWHRVDIRFVCPYASPRRFSAGELIDNRRVPFDASSMFTRRIRPWQLSTRRWLGTAKTIVDACVLGWLAALVAVSLRDIRRGFFAGGPPRDQRRRILAVFACVAIVEACLFAAPWAHRLMLLLGGDDPLTYEFMARRIQFNGLLLRELDGPFYYQVLYPYFLAAAHAVFGEGMFGVMLVQRLLVALVAYVLADIARTLAGDHVWPAAFCGSVLFAYGKFAPIVANNLMNEAVFVPLLACWAAALLATTLEPTARVAARAGLLGGIAALARSTTLLAWAAVLVPCWRVWKHPARRGLLSAALLVPALAVFSLIALRNGIVLHRFAPVPTELPVTLLGGNEPPPDLKIDPASHAALYDRIKLDPLVRRVAEYALTAPTSFAQNLGRKTLFALGFYEPYAAGWGSSPVFIVLWILGLAGLIIVLRAGRVPAMAAAMPALIAGSQFVAVVVVYPKAERLILPFYTLIVPYAAIAAERVLAVVLEMTGWFRSRAERPIVAGAFQPATPGRSRTIDALLIAAVFAYTFIIRTRGISEHFLMLGDQIRDWSIALGPVSKLPLVGTSSTAGNYSFGPVFYWVLWLSRITIGPFVDNLPHAGGLGLAAAQSTADIALYIGLRRCTGSWVFALASILIVASSPFDMALSSVIWNPVLAVACAKCATGLLLFWQQDLTRPRRIALLAIAWCAVQAHTAALPFAGCVFVWVLANQARAGIRTLAIALTEAVLVVAVLQVPAAFADQSIQPTRLQSAFTHPEQLRFIDAFQALSAAVESIALTPWRVPQITTVLLAAAAILLFRFGPRSAPVAITLLPVLLAAMMMSAWQEAYDFYWFLTIVPAALLMIMWVVRALGDGRLQAAATAALLILAVLAQPVRVGSAELVFRMPAYGPLVRGSRALVRSAPSVRRVDAPFLPPLSDPQFVFTILGGQIRPDAPVAARLSENGDVTYDAR